MSISVKTLWVIYFQFTPNGKEINTLHFFGYIPSCF